MSNPAASRVIESAFHLINGRNWEAAVRFVTEQVKLHPEESELWSALAVAQKRLHRYEESIQSGLRAIQLNPLDWTAHFAVGSSLIDQDDCKGGIEHIKKALAQQPENPSLLCFHAIACFELGRLDEALKSANDAIRSNPQYGDGLRIKALTLARMGKMKQSQKWLSRVFELEPADRFSHHYAGEVQLVGGDYYAAEASFREALRLDPGCHQSFEGLGLALAAQERVNEAKIVFREALRLNPRLKRARRSLQELEKT